MTEYTDRIYGIHWAPLFSLCFALWIVLLTSAIRCLPPNEPPPHDPVLPEVRQ